LLFDLRLLFFELRELLARQRTELGVGQHGARVGNLLLDAAPTGEGIHERKNLAPLAAQLLNARAVRDDRGVAHQVVDLALAADDGFEFVDGNHWPRG
jgi:hypothetical protein